MIVSASYRTDIPAFYGRWFLNRFAAGWVKVVNPYGGGVSTVPLRAGVDGFVFWSRNAGPFRPALDTVRAAGFPFVLHHTVLGYPREIERRVIDPARAVAVMGEIAARHGPEVVVWRYDPILLGRPTPPDWHLDHFAALASALEGTTTSVVVSFATLYRKSIRNLRAALPRGGDWTDPPLADKHALLSRLAAVAARRGMRLSVCAQPEVCGPDLPAARCVDAERLGRVALGWGRPRPIVAREKGTRPGCNCHESRDIGDYDTCPHGCAYCYAVGSPALARRRFAAHDPDGEFLVPPAGLPPPAQGTLL